MPNHNTVQPGKLCTKTPFQHACKLSTVKRPELPPFNDETCPLTPPHPHNRTVFIQQALLLGEEDFSEAPAVLLEALNSDYSCGVNSPWDPAAARHEKGREQYADRNTENASEAS